MFYFKESAAPAKMEYHRSTPYSRFGHPLLFFRERLTRLCFRPHLSLNTYKEPRTHFKYNFFSRNAPTYSKSYSSNVGFREIHSGSYVVAFPLQRLIKINQVVDLNGEPNRVRTCDLLIKSQPLYQLSYGPPPKGVALLLGNGAEHMNKIGLGQPTNSRNLLYFAGSWQKTS